MVERLVVVQDVVGSIPIGRPTLLLFKPHHLLYTNQNWHTFVMFEILTPHEMQKAEASAIASGINSFQLMLSAGASVAELIKKNFQQTPVLVLCGKGKNGGDGFVAATQLQKEGWPVRVACLVKKTTLKTEALQAAKEWPGAIEDLNSNLSIKDTGLIIDAVFGTGFSGSFPPELSTLFDKVRNKNISVVAIDLPSGLDSASGSIADGTLSATMTITFSRKKRGHLLLPGKSFCGKVCVADIGIPDKIISDASPAVFENHFGLWLKSFPIPKQDTHKYARGNVCIYGGKKRTGAACLAAAAAQKTGAGAVTILSSPETESIYRQYRASLMVDTFSNSEELKNVLRDERKNVFVLGPGAGTEDAVKESIDLALSFNKSFVLDADIFSLYKNNSKELFDKLSPKCVLTPHMGEFERLFPDIVGNKVEKAQKAAKVSNSIVVLKGSDTVIAAPDGTAVINSNAPPTLAIAGSGDILAGFIAGLIAQGMPSFMAACAACWLHGETAKNYGFCLTPEDIISNVNHTLNKLFGVSNLYP